MSSVFVVDDGEDQRELLRELLEDAGFQVKVFEDARLALEEAQRTPPSLIILDWFMPHLGGGAFVQRVRAEPGLANVRLLILSGALHVDATGVDEVLIKPADVRELLARVGELCCDPADREAPDFEVGDPPTHSAISS